MFSEVCFGRPKPATLAGFKNLPKINRLRIYFAKTTQNYNFMGFSKLRVAAAVRATVSLLLV